jgi:hypothetical protein
MITVNLRPHISPNEPLGASMRSDRLLRGMHKVFNHDLPNQIVSLQSLLQMLQEEEYDRLSDDGREYVNRLQNVTQRVSEMVRFLKEMNKLNACAGKPEAIALDLLAREIQGTLKQHFPRTEFAFVWQWSIPTIVGDYRTFMQALTEILTCLMPASADACRLEAGSENMGNRIAVHFMLASGAPVNDNKPHMARAGQVPVEKRMETVLARACLAVSEATLEMSSGNGKNSFTIFVPSR